MSYATELAGSVLAPQLDIDEARALASQVIQTEMAAQNVARFLGGKHRPTEAILAELNRLRLEATLLARAWRNRETLSADDITRHSIDDLAAQHYRPGELEPIDHKPPHPWRMTSELASALTALTTCAAVVDVSPGEESKDALCSVAIMISEMIRAQVKE